MPPNMTLHAHRAEVDRAGDGKSLWKCRGRRNMPFVYSRWQVYIAFKNTFHKMNVSMIVSIVLIGAVMMSDV